MTQARDGDVLLIKPSEPVMSVQKLPYFMGVSKNTAGTTGLAMHIVVIPPGGQAESHYHLDFETAIFVLEGIVETRYGLNLEKSVVSGPGEFLFIPPFVPHQPRNLSNSKPARAVVARNDSADHERVQLYS